MYERAIAQVPPIAEKRFWQRYIYLWINFALYEELEAKDLERTRQVYAKCLEIIPHKQFTFAKIWLMAGTARRRFSSPARSAHPCHLSSPFSTGQRTSRFGASVWTRRGGSWARR